MRAGKDVIGRRRTGSVSGGRPDIDFDEDDVDDQIDETDPRFLRDSLGQLNESINTKVDDEDVAIQKIDDQVEEMLAIKTWEGCEESDEIVQSEYDNDIIYKGKPSDSSDLNNFTHSATSLRSGSGRSTCNPSEPCRLWQRLHRCV
jgi:hypothetical protein